MVKTQMVGQRVPITDIETIYADFYLAFEELLNGADPIKWMSDHPVVVNYINKWEGGRKHPTTGKDLMF